MRSVSPFTLGAIVAVTIFLSLAYVTGNTEKLSQMAWQAADTAADQANDLIDKVKDLVSGR